MEESMQVFVKIDQYKEVLEIMNMIKNKMAETKEVLSTINRLKNEEDSELELWNSSVEEAQKRLDHIDKILFAPEKL
ncbi:MAG: hypothetical protein WC471_00080 [Candidatus Woesearchaeota archaeon]